jgi:hypothetical protein
MAEFRITFGQRYYREYHPAFVEGRIDFEPDPDGWVTVIAEDEGQAREMAFAQLGRAWAFVYPEPFGPEWMLFHPDGELGRLTREGQPA